MGNGSSAYIVIEFENNGNICAGDPLKGRLLLDVRKTISADYLMFRFYGHERTAVIYTVQVPYYETVTVMVGDQYQTRQEQRFRTEYRTAHDSVNIFSAEVILHTFRDGSIAEGQYAFPFEVAIPRGLPGSQHYNSGGNSCSISYHCEAKLHRPGMLTWSVKNSREVLMNDEPYKSFPTPMFIGPTTTKVTFMCVISRGTMTFGGKVNTTNVCANERLRLDYGICNESTSRVKALEIDVICYIGFSADGHTFNTSHKTFSRRIEAASLIGADPLKEKGDGVVDYKAILKQINQAECGVDIPIGNDIRSTYNGRLSSVRYELSMSIKTTFGTRNKTIKIPIIMHRNGSNFSDVVPEVEEAHPVPNDWNAVEIPTAVLILEEPEVILSEGYDTVNSLLLMVKQSSQWWEINALNDWLAHSPNNINLLTPDKLHVLFKCIKGDYSYYTFSKSIGEAMKANIDSTNKCTCKHIAESARAVPQVMKIAVCNTFAPYCVDKENATVEFRVIGIDDIEMTGVMMNYN